MVMKAVIMHASNFEIIERIPQRKAINLSEAPCRCMWLWLPLALVAELRLSCTNGKFVPDRAYQNDWSFDSLYLEDCFEVIGTSSFENTSVTSVRLPNTLVEILGYGFRNCKKLTSIVIPEGTSTLGGSCFASCSALTTVAIPASVLYIWPCVFTMVNSEIELVINSANTVYEWRDGLLIDKQKTSLVFARDCYTNFTVPSDLVRLEQACLEHMAKMQSIEAKSIKDVGQYAFRGDTNLVNVTFGSGLSAWQTSAFDRCISMKDVFIEGHETFTSIDGVLYQKSNDSIMIVYLPPKKATSKFVVPKEVTAIDGSPFKATPVSEFEWEEGHPTLSCYAGVIYSKDFTTPHNTRYAASIP